MKWTLGGEIMANIKSAIKRVDTNNKKRELNLNFKSAMRTEIKRVEKLVEENNATDAKAAFKVATKKIDKAIQKGIIHRNTGNREKSRLAQKVNALGA